jgi:lipopolysaccharide transport system permease protein
MCDQTVTVIVAGPSTLAGRIRSAWQYRHFYPVLLHEISMRKYRNTLLGFWWLIIRPLIPMTVAIVIFTFFLQIDTASLPYGVFFLAGFITWNLFQSCVQFMARTMLWTRGLLKRMYLPKLLVPLASVGPALIELVVTTVLFALLIAFFYLRDGRLYIEPSWRLLMLLPCLVLTFAMALAVGMVVSAIALFMRDIIYSIAYITQMVMLLTPVVYPLSALPEGVQWVFYIVNPMTVLVETSRWSLTGFGDFSPLWFALGCIQAALWTYLCMLFFTRVEAHLADMA